jgi:serine/threonine protein phosphatase PrpC
VEQSLSKPQLFIGKHMQEPVCVPLADGLACVFTIPRPGRETANEDSAALIPGEGGSAVLAVADGLGGLPAGSLASGLALQQLADSVAGRSGEDQREAVLTGIETANTAVMTDGQGGGTTLAVVSIDNGSMRAYCVGDSMVMVCGQRGKLKYQSVAHSPVGYAQRSGMLDEDEAMFHDERHLVSNIVGTAEMHVEIGPSVNLDLYDTVVAGSDGLFDNLFISEIVERVRSGPLDVAARRLLESCLERMASGEDGQPHKPDDLSFILYRRNGRRRTSG